MVQSSKILNFQTGGAQSRLRKRGRDGRWSYTCTVRRPECKGQTIEVKTPLSRKDYEYLLNHTDNKRLPIYKTRRCFMYNNQSYQLDIYRLVSFLILEIS